MTQSPLLKTILMVIKTIIYFEHENVKVKYIHRIDLFKNLNDLSKFTKILFSR